MKFVQLPGREEIGSVSVLGVEYKIVDEGSRKILKHPQTGQNPPDSPHVMRELAGHGFLPENDHRLGDAMVEHAVASTLKSLADDKRAEAKRILEEADEADKKAEDLAKKEALAKAPAETIKTGEAKVADAKADEGKGAKKS